MEFLNVDDRLSDYRHLLTEHVLHPWFPRCLDLEHGGFLSGFDHAWRPTGEHHKLLEFQARQTSAAAELLMCFPACDLLRSAVATGFAFLGGSLWDREHGGWFACTDRSGHPLNTGDKHAHGTAYAIEACFLVSAVTGDEAAAKLGKTGLEWLNKYAYDPVGGGYWGAMTRTGTIRRSGPGPRQVDHLGTPFGLKDMNVNKDVLSMLTRATGIDPSLKADCNYDRQLDFVLRCFGEPECPRHHIDRNGKSCSTYWKPSEAVQLAGMLMEAMPQEPRADELLAAARKLLTKSYRDGWSNKGGGLLVARRDGTKPSRAELAEVAWWPQFELLKSATYLSHLDPTYELAGQMSDSAWKSIKSWFLDRRHGGLNARSTQTIPFISRLLETRRYRHACRKGDIWKDASHEARALLRLLQTGRVLQGKLPADLGAVPSRNGL